MAGVAFCHGPRLVLPMRCLDRLVVRIFLLLFVEEQNQLRHHRCCSEWCGVAANAAATLPLVAQRPCLQVARRVAPRGVSGTASTSIIAASMLPTSLKT